MSPPRLSLCSLLLFLALASSASAQDGPGSREVAGSVPQGFDQTVYKGLIGNVLDAIPMNPSERLDLQRTNAVVSNTLFGRSLTGVVGLSNPVFLLGGLVWGVWAASNIKPAEAGIERTVDSGRSSGGTAAQEHTVALLYPSSAADDAPANRVPKPILVSSISAGDSDGAVVSRSHVVKIWLPQRSPVLSR
jgi:hypothetical protein